MQKASFMVNKTSTIKRIYGSGAEVARSGDSKSKSQKVWGRCTNAEHCVQLQAADYGTVSGFVL